MPKGNERVTGHDAATDTDFSITVGGATVVTLDGEDTSVNYTIKIAYSGTNIEYVGKATLGSSAASAVWQIMKLTYTGSLVTDVQWADSVDTFIKVWDNRATYTYG